MKPDFKYIDFKNIIFEYPDLKRIIGEPTTDALITLQNKVKVNVQALHSTFFGGEYVHLCLVCSPETYATLVSGNTPYIKLPYHCYLIIEGHKMQYQIVQWHKKHTNALHLFLGRLRFCGS